MPKFYYPLEVMRLRSAELASSHGATFGMVRNSGTAAHQGWDLDAPVGTVCFAIADGVVVGIQNAGAYGRQLSIQFNRDGSTGASVDPLIAFYAHLDQILVSLNDTVAAGQPVARTGISGNASASAPHLHFEIRTATGSAGTGLGNRLDPMTVLGGHLYNSSNPTIGGVDPAAQQSVVRNLPTPVLRVGE